MATDDLTVARLREILNYDPETGVFTRRTGGQGFRCEAGRVAGSPHSAGYINISVLGKRRLAHRLAWFYVHGQWPVGDIDHIDGDRSNNRIANLRSVNRSGNLQNQRAAKPHNKTGFLGVRLDTRLKTSERKYVASIVVDGRQHRIGSYYTPEDAHAAYLEAKRKHHPTCTI